VNIYSRTRAVKFSIKIIFLTTNPLPPPPWLRLSKISQIKIYKKSNSAFLTLNNNLSIFQYENHLKATSIPEVNLKLTTQIKIVPNELNTKNGYNSLSCE